MRHRLNAAVLGAQRSAIREFSNLARATPGCISLTLGEPDFDTPEPVRAAARAALDAGETHYIPNNGAPELLRALSAYEKRVNGLDYAPEEIIVTAGATEALFVALFGILNPGDEVIIPTPAFLLYGELVRLCRAEPVLLDTAPAGFQLSEQALAARITERTRAIVLNSPNNPTGCVYNLSSLEGVLRASAGREIFVICDDVYRRLVYTGDCPSLAALWPRSERQRLLVAQSFSKPWAMTGWRMGALLADREIKERLELVHQYTVTSTPAPFQRAAMKALEVSPDPLRAVYQSRRDYVLGRLEDMRLPVQKPEGAFYVFPSVAGLGLDSGTLCTRLIQEAGVALTPGACFGAEGYVRLSYCAGGEALREGLDRMERFIARLRAEQGA